MYIVSDKTRFKQENLENWRKNSAFWLEGRMRHLKDLDSYMAGELRYFVERLSSPRRPLVCDLGCGEGWIYRILKREGLSADYLGVDFNEDFIISLRETHCLDEHSEFVVLDLEGNIPDSMLGKVDLAVNCFNFFELPNIERAFSNVAKMLNKGATLLVVTIDPTMQILAISENLESFKSNLALYEQFNTQLGYDKDTDIGDEKSGRIYRGILYSASTYIEMAKRNGLLVGGMKEVVKTANSIPQIYQLLWFENHG
jgi:SAM-dependent methyltransferase